MASIETWDWASTHVQTEIKNGQYVSAESALLLAGPPRLDQLKGLEPGLQTPIGGDADATGEPDASTAELFGIGLLTDYTLTQNHPLQRLFEIGSKRSYFVVGRTFTRFNMGRVKFFGPSLLRVLYSYYPTDAFIQEGVANRLAGHNARTRAQFDRDERPAQIKAFDVPGFGESVTDKDTAGRFNRDFWINFQSQIFSQPLGLCGVLRTANDYNYGAFYMQDTYLENHAFSINSAQVMMAEQVAGECDNIRPVQLLATPDQINK